MLEGMGHRLKIGDAAAIRASYVRKQKTDRRDAGHILRLLVEGRFPSLWVPSSVERDARQLVVHRHKRVQMRTRVKNQLHALAINQGLRLRWQLWTRGGRQQLEALELVPYAAARRAGLLRQLEEVDGEVGRLEGTGGEDAGRRTIER